MSQGPLRVAVAGLGFGAEFLPIYRAHPDAECVAICQRTQAKLDEVGDAHGIAARYTDFDAMLRDDSIDAVHINTPIPAHAEQTLAALEAGKHVACTVPMATSVEDCRRIVETAERVGKVYMMMETVVYSREYLYMKDLLDRGELGRLQFVQASHMQDMEGWPDYWPGLPPMHYATHVVGPCLGMTGAEADSVSCHGSGRIADELAAIHDAPFAVESAHITLRGSDVVARVHRSLFDTARQYRESIDVYGSKQAVEWPLIEHRPLVKHVAKRPEQEIPEEVECPDFAHLLPEPIQPFTTGGVYDLEGNTHLSFTQGGGHGGSHPHLVHAFVEAVRGHRRAFPDVRQSANWTCVGILAHESAMEGGAPKALPDFTHPA